MAASGDFDDIIVEGRPAPELAEQLLARLRTGGVFAVRSDDAAPCSTRVDVGGVHYRGHWLSSTGGGQNPEYHWHRDCELTPGGHALFIGAGGPLGQMHLQRALSLPHPPGMIVATQRGGPRLGMLNDRFAPQARQRGVEWVLLDARELGESVYDSAMQATGGKGYHDVVTIAPDADAVVNGFRLLSAGGGLNIFAGLPVGTEVSLDLARVYHDEVRLWGTSGSTISDLHRIVERAEAGQLETGQVVAAVGGIGAVAEGLAAVRDARFMGKTVIYPNLSKLPLLSLEELASRHHAIASALSDGRYWNSAAESELFRLYGDA